MYAPFTLLSTNRYWKHKTCVLCCQGYHHAKCAKGVQSSLSLFCMRSQLYMVQFVTMGTIFLLPLDVTLQCVQGISMTSNWLFFCEWHCSTLVLFTVPRQHFITKKSWRSLKYCCGFIITSLPWKNCQNYEYVKDFCVTIPSVSEGWSCLLIWYNCHSTSIKLC